MNKFMAIIAAAGSLAGASMSSTTAASAGEVLDKVLGTKTLTVAVGTDWGEMSFLNDKHELDGYGVAVAKAVAERLGVQAQFVTPGWDVIVASNWQARWDLAMYMTPTKARAEKFDFPAVYFYEPVLAAAHKNSQATKLSDLGGKVVGVASNTAGESYVNRTLKPDWIGAQPVQFQFDPGEVKTYASTNIALDDLRLGDGVRLDAVLSSGPILRGAIKSGYPLKELDGIAFYAPSAIVAQRDDKEFSDKIAAAVQSMRDGGTLSQLSIKWYGVDYTSQK
ncbi:transporter substrate-binding domain-containing protein [Mesorhizobium sp. M0854]|uniref:transporter substrate-binding domain-containing protein n=1 Tax=Mesorhizobium sp. M0854 TaxID=2957013 RepID=UPI003337B07F